MANEQVPMSDHRVGLANGISAYLLWGLLTIYWHELHGLDALAMIGVRVTLSVVVCVLVVRLRGSWPAIRAVTGDRQVVARLIAAAVMLSINWLSYVWVVTHDNVIESALGYFIAPLGMVLVGVFALGEHLRRPQLIGLTCAALAVGVLTVGYGKPPWFALIIAGSWTAYSYLKKTVPLDGLQSLTAETLILLPASLVVLVLNAFSNDSLATNASGVQIVLLALTGLATAVPLLLFGAATRRVPFTTLGPLQYIVPTINFALGVLLYDESLPLWRMLGFALVWVGLGFNLIDTIRSMHKQRQLVTS
jgi:chloramphenicol-sensitive protein RarD